MKLEPIVHHPSTYAPKPSLTFSAIFRHVPRSTHPRAQRWTRGAAAGPGETRQSPHLRKPQNCSLTPRTPATPSAARRTAPRPLAHTTTTASQWELPRHHALENAVFQPATRRGQANTRARGRSDRRSSRTRTPAPAHARARSRPCSPASLPHGNCHSLASLRDSAHPDPAHARRPGKPRTEGGMRY